LEYVIHDERAPRVIISDPPLDGVIEAGVKNDSGTAGMEE
jgi:hypothetical protein